MKHRTELVVRTYECDMNGHVNNANYLHYLEYARHEYLKAIGFDFAGSIESGYGLYVTRIEIDYKRSAMLDDRLIIESAPVKKGAVSGVMEQSIRRGDDLVTLARVSWAFVDATGKPTRIPPELDVPGLSPA
ncbi:MAG: 4-hydroxybenzoyl-CoA thioesterase [Spirochaetae bacterium HGW-Spirochaetae-3]|jgi:acyl-CoA thioester hydrolase|nr:MAG: 4-hydroxybenzoyl-CoA thioesterase [Spirochaetae bacterium HGW-Spirochaetae-3]